jgi:hypothetical protein
MIALIKTVKKAGDTIGWSDYRDTYRRPQPDLANRFLKNFMPGWVWQC